MRHLQSAGTILPITKLAGMGAEMVAQPARIGIHMGIRFVVMYRQGLQRRFGTSLCHLAGLTNNPVQLVSQVCR
jgi:hypothetical protein